MLTLYKYITAALAFAGCGSLLLTGEMNPVFLTPGLMLIPGYYRYVRGRPAVSRWLVAGLAVLELFVLAFDVLVVSPDFLIAIAHMTIVFQALKSFDMREPWDPLQVYFMSILQMIITSELSLSIVVGIAFVVFLLIFMAALVLSHFMKEGTLEKVRFWRPLAVISVATLVMTVVFFIIVPRMRGGLWGRTAASGLRTVGFSGNVDLGAYGDVLTDDNIVMRADIQGAGEHLYWRGASLDNFDGQRWSNTLEYRIRLNSRDGYFNIPFVSGAQDGSYVKQKIVVEPMDTEVIFALDDIRKLSVRRWIVQATMPGTVYLPGKNNRRVTYTALSHPGTANRKAYKKWRNAYLQMPQGMQRVRELSTEVSADAGTTMQKASAIEQYLLDGHTYTLSPGPPPEGVSPLQWFLFGAREGYCQHYSTAMAMMLRTLGIPSRIVTGFSGGDLNDFGNYVIVRQRNAHSWVEAAIDGYWHRFDPTPAIPEGLGTTFMMMLDSLRMDWYRYVVGFSRADQSAMLSSLAMPVFKTPELRGFSITVNPAIVIAGIFMVIVACYYIFIRHAKIRVWHLSAASKAFVGFRRRVVKRGGKVGPCSTAHEVALAAKALYADPQVVEEILDLYTRARFSGIKPEEGQLKRLRILCKKAF